MNQWLIRTFVKEPDKIHDPEIRLAYGTLASSVGIVGNILLCTMKAVIGFSIHSVAIVADAANNLSDTASNIVTMIGFKLSSLPADKEHPYGHGRYEYLSSMIVSVLILIVGYQVVVSSSKSLVHPKDVILTPISVFIMVLSIAIKAWMATFNKTVGKKISSQALLTAAIDSKYDCITTLTVLVCTWLSDLLHVPWLNGLAGLIVGILILKSGWECLMDSVNPLMGCPPDPKRLEAIRQKIMSYPHVLGIHDLVLHDYGPGRTFASVHVEMPSDLTLVQAHQILDDMQYDFYTQDQIDMTTHLDPEIKNDGRTMAIEDWIEGHKGEISKRLTFHDFHSYEEMGVPTVMFDCSAPFDLKMTDEEITNRLCKLFHVYNPHLKCKIRIDRF